jgi:tetratricopeptide (TPR) repeat protein
MKYIDLLSKRGAYTQASVELKKVLATRPDYEDAANRLVSIYVKADRRDKLGVFLRDYVDTFPERLWAMTAYVRLLNSIGDLSPAEAALNHAIDDSHASSDVYLLYAKVLDSEKRFPDAIKVLDQGLGKFPNDARFLFDIALCQEHSGDLAKATQVYESVSPDNAEIYYQARVNLAGLHEKERNYAKALSTLTALRKQIGETDELLNKIHELRNQVDSAARGLASIPAFPVSGGEKK